MIKLMPHFAHYIEYMAKTLYPTQFMKSITLTGGFLILSAILKAKNIEWLESLAGSDFRTTQLKSKPYKLHTMKKIYNSGFELILAYPNLNELNSQNKMDKKPTSSDSLYVYFGVTLLAGILAGLVIQSSILQHGGVPLYLTMNQKKAIREWER